MRMGGGRKSDLGGRKLEIRGPVLNFEVQDSSDHRDRLGAETGGILQGDDVAGIVQIK